MLRFALLLLALGLPLSAQQAKNVILFLGDAGGVATLHAASILGHGEPQKLYIQGMPHLGLSDTSTASQWNSDSAAGMTAIVSGHKTHNGVVSQGPDAVRGKQDGATLKTILEYAEERGLSTGVVTNMTATDATPAATFAHVNDRKDFSRIFQQLLEPSFGDGVDIDRSRAKQNRGRFGGRQHQRRRSDEARRPTALRVARRDSKRQR